MSVALQLAEFRKVLVQMDVWLDKGAAHATAKSFDSQVLAQSRLAPDQFALNRQVQAACDAAKYAAAYLSGQPAPSHPDTETTLPELKQRIQKVLTYLDGFKAEDFADADSRIVSPGWARGKTLKGEVYFHQVAVPNFYFHATTTYAILRHNGVPVGKMDFLGDLAFSE